MSGNIALSTVDPTMQLIDEPLDHSELHKALQEVLRAKKLRSFDPKTWARLMVGAGPSARGGLGTIH